MMADNIKCPFCKRRVKPLRLTSKEIDKGIDYYIEKGRQIADTKWRQILKDRDAGTDMSFGTLAELQDTVMRAHKAGIEKGRQKEREKYNEAIILVVDVAGLNQNVFGAETIASLSDRAEDILKALKGEAQ